MRVANIAFVAVVAACAGGTRQAGPSSPPSTACPEPIEDAPNASPASRVETTPGGELVLVQSMIVSAPIESVWQAYTTSEGWRAWVAPVAEVDFRAGGIIRSHYTPGANLGDPGTIELRVVNYVPLKFLTLQADVAANFPDFVKRDADNLFNVVTFEKLGARATRIVSYGVGYRDTEKYRELLEFFTGANEQTLAKLKAYVESR